MPTAEVVRRLAEADVPCAGAQLDKCATYPQTVAVGVIRDLVTQCSDRHADRVPRRFDSGVVSAHGAWAPTLGQHTNGVLEQAG